MLCLSGQADISLYHYRPRFFRYILILFHKLRKCTIFLETRYVLSKNFSMVLSNKWSIVIS